MQNTGTPQNRGTTPGMPNGATQVDESLIRRIFSALNEHDVNKSLAFVSPDCTIINVPINRTYQGHSGFREFLQGWITAFPDYKLELTNYVCSGDKCMVDSRPAPRTPATSTCPAATSSRPTRRSS